MKGMERLLELQELDLSIDRLESRKADLEAGTEVEASRVKVHELEEKVGEIRLTLDSVRQEQSRLETEVASLEAKIGAEQARLYDGSVANPKELESIQAEVAGLGQRKARIEDQVLEQMERRETLEGRLPPQEQELAEARRRLDELEQASIEELKEIESAMGERRSEREALVPELDEELVELYADLRAQKRGVGAAALLDGVCQGCHEKLSPLELDRIKKAEGVRRCTYCRRILVLS